MTALMITVMTIALLSLGSWAQAQPGINQRTQAEPGPAGRTVTTIVEMKLIAANDGGGLHSQQWGKLLEPMNISVQIQRPNSLDKPEIRERTVGTLRYVTLVGSLDRAGNASFPGKSFSPSDGQKLREWIEELKVYGAQGKPDGQPNWGLTKEQFAALYDSLLKPLDAEVSGLAITDALLKLPLPPKNPVRFSAEATRTLSQAGANNRSRQELRGFTAATALAILLNDCGLGFRPNRTSSGNIELLVEPLGQSQHLWPVGWPMQKPPLKAAPKFYAMTPIELDQVALDDLLTTVSELTETPILIDYYEIGQKHIDLSKLTVSFKRQSATSWSIALKTVVVPKKLSREVWQDEAGRAFVWITTNRPGRSGTHME